MDSPIRKQLKRNDYLRHKMFRKIKRRRKAERELAINAPAKELRRRLRKRTFKCGKDAYLDGKDKELPYPLRTSKDYDDNEAYQAGIVRDPVTGHMWSTTQEEYPKERRYLKRPGHPTFPHSVWADKNAGYDVYMRDGQFYSAPTLFELMYTKPPFAKKKPNYASGKDSGIHIKPENRGKFTRLKKRTGKSASWFKAHGTPAQKKMAVFALNSRKWSHKK